jgi:hypothetical protein
VEICEGINEAKRSVPVITSSHNPVPYLWYYYIMISEVVFGRRCSFSGRRRTGRDG